MAEVHDVTVTPAVVQWARKSIGWNRKEAAARLGLPPGRLAGIEAGEIRPSWGELRRMAKAYHRPPAALLLSVPPREPTLPGYFRTVNNESVSAESLSAETLLAIRRARHIRNLFLALEQGERLEKGRLPRASVSADPGETARKVATYLHIVDPGTNPRFEDERDAIRKWRRILFSAGIVALQLPFPEDEARGFSIPDTPFPVVVASQHDSPKARVFTLFHELGHLVLGSPGICEISFRSVKDPGSSVERFCNAFSGRMLVPDAALSNALARIGGGRGPGDHVLGRLSSHFCVSQEVILRRMLDTKRLELDEYREWASNLRAGYTKETAAGPGGGADYVRLRYNEYGPEFAGAVLHSVDAGRLTYRDAVDFLGLKVDHLARVRQLVDRERNRGKLEG